MKLTVLSLFPEILRGFFESSIMAKSAAKGLIEYELVDIRDYATDKHRKCDDEIFGGGAGMLMLPGPLSRALEAAGARPAGEQAVPVDEQAAPAGEQAASAGGQVVPVDDQAALAGDRVAPAASRPRTIYLSPSGRLLNQALAQDLAREEHLILVCGRYEGIDQRVIDSYVDDEISIGDYVLSSGEVAALVLVDAVYRLIPGVIKGESLAEESFSGPGGSSLLEYPQYTRPAVYATVPVPEVLLSGHHAKITRWRLREQVRKTLAYRPELLAVTGLPDEVRRLIKDIATEGGIDEPHPEDPGHPAQA
jgi:tRNA (guanine37-N1)-methyltransferase